MSPTATGWPMGVTPRTRHASTNAGTAGAGSTAESPPDEQPDTSATTIPPTAHRRRIPDDLTCSFALRHHPKVLLAFDE
jgi:hypothetical protein